MIEILKNVYRKVRFFYHRLQLYYSVNWTKTVYFNFKKFPFNTAKKLPFVFFGKVSFQSIKGEVIINAPIKMGMVSYGQYFEIAKRAKGTAEIYLLGKLVINGPLHIGKDVLLYVGENAHCEFGYMSCLGSDVKLVCTQEVHLGDWAGIGYESQIIDTNSHPMMNSETGEYYPIQGSIFIGSHNAVSNRVSIMPNTKTPDFCVIASNTLCNKDYTSLGSNILMGGVPAKLLKKNYTRDWDGEKELLKKYKIIDW
ncbi:acyltransferase [Flavobacterium sp. RSP49]|uniref:acyltransferase n=1 Tax=Flavobacterium sp. RSP49 TaxID=2497487 RepID=UPI001F2A202D|nr:transferase [Flavobacterium sp. RSP49]